MMSSVYDQGTNAFVIGEYDDYYILNTDNAEEDVNSTATPAAENETVSAKEPAPSFSCDHQIILYILNQQHFEDEIATSSENVECHPPYWASYVTKTNLLLAVVRRVDAAEFAECPAAPSTHPVPTSNSTTSSDPCHKLDLGRLHRRRLEGCFTYHDDEARITACGLGSRQRASLALLALAVAARLFY